MRKKYMLLIFIMSILITCYVNTAPCIGKDPANSSGLIFWRVGNIDGINKRFGTNMYQILATLHKNKDELDCFLLAIAEQPLAERKIIEKCSIPSSHFHHFITTLKSVKLIKKNSQDKWATTVPVVTDKQMRRIRESLLPIARGIAQYLKNEAPQIKMAYDKGKSPTDPSWEKVSHLVIDKFIIDGTFHRAVRTLEGERGFKQYYSRDQKHITAFFLKPGANYSTFGTNWYPFKHNKKKREVYILHGALFNRIAIPFNRFRDDRYFSSILHRLTPGGSLRELTGQEKNIFKELGWIENDRLLTPILRAKNIKTFLPVLKKIGTGAAEVVFKNYSIIIDSFNKSPYAKFMAAGGDYIQVCYHVLFSEIIKQSIEAGVLPSIPEPIPEYFGVFITIGSVFE